ncbi:hypothetical protein BH10PSE16_BH10PSE16_00760 [soil metagenome]
MPSSSIFLHIEAGAHGGAFGDNSLPTPTDAQCKAGNYKLGRVTLYGLNIAIEQPRGTYRTGMDASGKRWSSRMAAHYGYFAGTKGNDGDEVDCFVGFYPQSELAYVINQNIDGRFDETKVMLAFPDEESARRAYADSYERNWPGLASIVPTSISQLKWWLKNGNMTRPLKPEHLPHEGLEVMTRRTQWNADALPYDQTLDQVLYDIRRADHGEGLTLDSVSLADIVGDSDGVLVFDAMVTPFAGLERKMAALQRVMERTGQAVKPVALQITEPFTQRGVANVAAIFELSDGQTVSIYFHNPDVTPKKMLGTDELISWKWLLNKKDITIVVAPERGEDLDINEVAKRIMKLAEKNSAAFQRANSKRAETMQRLAGLNDEIAGLETELKVAQNELEAAKIAAEDRAAAPTPIPAIVPAKPTETDPEAELRAMWTEQGVPQARQDELIAQIGAKAQPGTQVGPFTIGGEAGPQAKYAVGSRVHLVGGYSYGNVITKESYYYVGSITAVKKAFDGFEYSVATDNGKTFEEVSESNIEPLQAGFTPEGRESKVKTAKGTEVVTGFAVVEADRLITSHNPATGDVNPEFPQELQPRDRGRETSRAWVLKTAANLDPEQLGKTRRADTGAPIVGPDRVVESGNGRTMAIIEAYRISKADEYRAWLESEADYFGLSVGKVKSMKRPVLVRIRISNVNRAEFAVEANQDDKLAMTATEKARADANRLTDDMIALMTDNGDLNAAANTAFLSSFLRSLGDAEAAQYSTREGKPTSSLIARVQAAIFAKAYNDDRLLELTADSARPEIANIISALNFAAPEFIQSAALDPVAAGGATKKLTDSIEASLNEQAVAAIIGATNVIKQAKESGMQVDEFVKQQGLFGDLDPSVAAMAVFIAKNNRSAKRMGAAFKAMATFVKGEIERRQTSDMFGEPVPIGFPEIIAAANRELDRMFGEGAFAIETVDLFAPKAGLVAVPAPANTAIELTGMELGDFPDTPEGKKALREAAKENLNLLVGKRIPCPALGGDVEIRKKGIKEFISRSADTRKLKVAAAIESLIRTSKKLATRSPYDGDVDKSALAYHTMRAEFTLEGEPLAARLVIKEDVNGVFHYDLTVHSAEAVFDSTKENGHNELRPSSETTSNGGGAADESAEPSRLASHQLDSTIAESGMVFNLFIEGEAPEAVEDDVAEQATVASSPAEEPVATASPSTPAEDPQTTADRALFKAVIDGTVTTSDGEGMLSAALADTLEAAYMRHAGNPEMDDLFEKAINAYTDAEVAASANL